MSGSRKTGATAVPGPPIFSPPWAARTCPLPLSAAGELRGAHGRLPGHLLRINGNAAPAEGDVASPHLTGATIDIAKKGLSPSEVGWMRAYLLPLEAAGKIDVEEEFQQACFHITVYKDYAPLYAPRVMTATVRHARPSPASPRKRPASDSLALETALPSLQHAEQFTLEFHKCSCYLCVISSETFGT